jgi:hypothetical protein
MTSHMKTDCGLIAADVDELLSKSERLAAMPTTAAPVSHHTITDPFGDARPVVGRDGSWGWDWGDLPNLGPLDNSLHASPGGKTLSHHSSLLTA